jgi:hypothetical protein
MGFRLQGPKFETEQDGNAFPRGISIDSCLGVEIANMELSGWSGQAIYLKDTANRMDDVLFVVQPGARWCAPLRRYRSSRWRSVRRRSATR